ncbi:DUF882 domain-containing protein [Cupriavidus basilensis]
MPESLAALNRFLRDHYSGEVGVIDPQLFAAALPPETNTVLRGTLPGHLRLSRSGHQRAPAQDARRRRGQPQPAYGRQGHRAIRLPGVPLADLRDAALSLRGGGAGLLSAGAVRACGHGARARLVIRRPPTLHPWCTGADIRGYENR